MGLLSSIGKLVSNVGHTVSNVLFGSKPKIEYPGVEKLIPQRDNILASFYHQGIPVYLGVGKDGSIDIGRLFNAKESYLNAFNNLARIQHGLVDYLWGQLPRKSFFNTRPPRIKTPFGEVVAYGIERSALNNKATKLGMINETGKLVGLLNSLVSDMITRPAVAQYDVDYVQPLNLFLKEDLARYGVHATPIGIEGSAGLLGTLGSAIAYQAAKPLTDWAISEIASIL